jgi:asparagine synthase (glutamine-hydrolysing)
MCGILGIIGPYIDKKRFESATAELVHRGPDDFGFYYDEKISLGHQRLSIIDLEGGRQPIFNEDGTKCIIFNGEIYNYLELREDLERTNHRFSTRSDTEVILHAYEEWGEQCVDRFRGMFALAIWDRREKRLFLARDRLGIKPLFYSECNGKFYFASEMKAILADTLFPRAVDEIALASYFMLSYIPAPFTIFKNIRKLPPGHTLLWKEDGASIRKYWDVEFVPDRGKSEQYFIEKIREMLEEAIKIRLISEVPLGAFLSGGIDSSTIVAMMSLSGSEEVKTFTVGFGGKKGGYLDERKYARLVANRYHTDHREYEVLPRPDGVIEKVVGAFDEPFADDSTIPTHFVCRTAKKDVTVALSGLGGDELFGGYERYLGFSLRNYYHRAVPSPAKALLRQLVEKVPERSDGHYTINHLKRFIRSDMRDPGLAYLGFCSKLNGLEAPLFNNETGFQKNLEYCKEFWLGHFYARAVADGTDSLNRVFYLDIKTYLPEDILAVTDRISMQHSLEVRVPFLDHKLVEFCATIPPEMKLKWLKKKFILKKAVQGLLPRDVIYHRKQGFVGPMAQWLKTDLKGYAFSTLSSENLKRHSLFHSESIERILQRHFSGKEIHDTLIWSLLIFQRWYERYLM